MGTTEGCSSVPPLVGAAETRVTAPGTADEDGPRDPWPAPTSWGASPARSKAFHVVRSSSYEGWITSDLTTLHTMKNRIIREWPRRIGK